MQGVGQGRLSESISIIAAIDSELSELENDTKFCLNQLNSDIYKYTEMEQKSELASEDALADAIAISKERQNQTVQRQINAVKHMVNKLLRELENEKNEIQNKKNELSEDLQVEVESQINAMRYKYERKLKTLDKDIDESCRKLTESRCVLDEICNRIPDIRTTYEKLNDMDKEKDRIYERQQNQLNSLREKLSILDLEKDELVKDLTGYDEKSPANENKMVMEKNKQEELQCQIGILEKQLKAKRKMDPGVLLQQLQSELEEKSSLLQALKDNVRPETMEIANEAKNTFKNLSMHLLESESVSQSLLEILENIITYKRQHSCNNKANKDKMDMYREKITQNVTDRKVLTELRYLEVFL